MRGKNEGLSFSKDPSILEWSLQQTEPIKGPAGDV